MPTLRLRRSWPVSWTLLLLPALLAAQQPLQSVTGVVRDTAGAPLGGADVILGQRTTTTSASGAFRVDSLRPGQYAITIRLIGYNPVRSRVVVVATEPTDMEYFMLPAPYQLAPLVVESRRTGIYGAVGDTGFKAAVGARVQVAGLQGDEMLTDSMGRFAFPAADRGVYMVRVTYPGYTPRQFTVELKPGEGRELGVLLAPSSRPPHAREELALQDLGRRLASGLARERLTANDLARHESGGLCDIGQIRAMLGGSDGATTTLVLNGVVVYRDFDVRSLCSWRADEVELVEFGTSVSRDPTGTIAEIMNVGSAGRARDFGGIRSGRQRAQGAAGSYVIIWEKR
jgi:hypothetical protein